MSVECFSLMIFNGFYARHGLERVLRFYDRQGEFVEAAAELFHALTQIESTVPRGIVYKILLLYQQNERQNCVLNGDGDTQEHVKISRSERRFFLSIFIFQRETQWWVKFFAFLFIPFSSSERETYIREKSVEN